MNEGHETVVAVDRLDVGNSFTGKENFTFEVPGTNPYAGGGTTFTGFTISATRITVNKSLLP